MEELGEEKRRSVKLINDFEDDDDDNDDDDE